MSAGSLRYRLAYAVHHHITGERAARAAGAHAVCVAKCCRRRWHLWRALDHAVIRQVRKGNR